MAMLNNQRVMNREELMIQIWQFWGFSHDSEEHLAVQHYNGDLHSLDTNKKWDMDEPTSTWFRCECGSNLQVPWKLVVWLQPEGQGLLVWWRQVNLIS